MVAGADDDHRRPAPGGGKTGEALGLAARVVGVGAEAEDADGGAPPRAEAVRLRPGCAPAVGDDEDRRDAAANEIESACEPWAPAAGEHDDRVCVRRHVLGRPHEEHGCDHRPGEAEPEDGEQRKTGHAAY